MRASMLYLERMAYLKTRDVQLGVRITPELKKKLLALQTQWIEERGPGREPTLTDMAIQFIAEGLERYLTVKR
jgi:hypothetical protein